MHAHARPQPETGYSAKDLDTIIRGTFCTDSHVGSHQGRQRTELHCTISLHPTLPCFFAAIHNQLNAMDEKRTAKETCLRTFLPLRSPVAVPHLSRRQSLFHAHSGDVEVAIANWPARPDGMVPVTDQAVMAAGRIQQVPVIISRVHPCDPASWDVDQRERGPQGDRASTGTDADAKGSSPSPYLNAPSIHTLDPVFGLAGVTRYKLYSFMYAQSKCA
ncbi:hypothetical protein RJ55_04383 [Drechmeria coniospora]|nr:hypothetical protein RJ55_04383 [Drechmeria coniospora]